MPVSMPADRPVSRVIQWTAHRATWAWALVVAMSPTVPLGARWPRGNRP